MESFGSWLIMKYIWSMFIHVAVLIGFLPLKADVMDFSPQISETIRNHTRGGGTPSCRLLLTAVTQDMSELQKT